MKKNIGDIVLNFNMDRRNVILEYCGNKVFFSNQSIDDLSKIIEINFKIVKKHYENNLNNRLIDGYGFNYLCLNIVIQFIYMYNLWNANSIKINNLSLEFNTKDFEDPLIFDIVTNYFKSHYSNNWMEKAIAFLNLSSDDFLCKYQNRQEFYNK